MLLLVEYRLLLKRIMKSITSHEQRMEGEQSVSQSISTKESTELRTRPLKKPMPNVVDIGSNQHASGASGWATLSTWIVIVQIFVLLIVLFRMERHLRRLEHRSLSQVRLVKGCMPSTANSSRPACGRRH